MIRTAGGRAGYDLVVDKVEAPDPMTVVFQLKFATAAFLPALADPVAFIYKKDILDKDSRWYESHILGSGAFKFSVYETGQSIKGVRNPDYYHRGRPYLDSFTGIYAGKEAVRVEAIRSDRAAIEFRSLPPAARDELVKVLGDNITVQESDLNIASLVTPNHKKTPFDDPRVRRALTLAIDRWRGTSPWFLLGGLLLGLIVGFYELAKAIWPGQRRNRPPLWRRPALEAGRSQQ